MHFTIILLINLTLCFLKNNYVLNLCNVVHLLTWNVDCDRRFAVERQSVSFERIDDRQS